MRVQHSPCYILCKTTATTTMDKNTILSAQHRISITDEERHSRSSQNAADMMNKTFNCWAKQLKYPEIRAEKTTHSIQIMMLRTALNCPRLQKGRACTKPFMQFHYYYSLSSAVVESTNIFFEIPLRPLQEILYFAALLCSIAKDDDHPTSEAIRKRQPCTAYLILPYPCTALHLKTLIHQYHHYFVATYVLRDCEPQEIIKADIDDILLSSSS